MPHILILGRIHEAGLALLRARPDVTFEMLATPSEADILATVPAADAILVRTTRISAAAIDAAPRLRVVSRHGVGYDNIDLAALDRRGIPLALVGNVNAVPVAEHALFLMLTLAKQGLAHDRATRDGRWTLRDGFGAIELAEKNLLVLGFGRIGREVAARARGFDMNIVAYDPFVDAETVRTAGAWPASDLKEALASADVVTIHLPLTAETRNIIDAEALARMKPTALLVCTARGGLVDEAALAEALAGRRIAGAGLDVFEEEPPPPDHPLLRLDNVVLSPHSAALTKECAIRMAEISARNALAGIDGGLDPELVVNRRTLRQAPRAAG